MSRVTKSRIALSGKGIRSTVQTTCSHRTPGPHAAFVMISKGSTRNERLSITDV
jgi:hypothetical protein